MCLYRHFYSVRENSVLFFLFFIIICNNFSYFSCSLSQHEINEAFKQRELNDALVSLKHQSVSSGVNWNNNNNDDENGANYQYRNGGIKSTTEQNKNNIFDKNHDSINMNCVGGKCRNMNSSLCWRDPDRNTAVTNANIQETNEWANSILKELDSLRTNGRQSDPSSIIGCGSDTMASTVRNISKVAPTLDLSKTTIISSPLPSPTSPSVKRSTIINVTLRKSQPVPTKLDDDKNFATNTNHNHILKPEKHVSLYFCFQFFFYFLLTRNNFFFVFFFFLLCFCV